MNEATPQLDIRHAGSTDHVKFKLRAPFTDN